jgi:hypothetical protein
MVVSRPMSSELGERGAGAERHHPSYILLEQAAITESSGHPVLGSVDVNQKRGDQHNIYLLMSLNISL